LKTKLQNVLGDYEDSRLPEFSYLTLLCNLMGLLVQMTVKTRQFFKPGQTLRGVIALLITGFIPFDELIFYYWANILLIFGIQQFNDH
jgi:hypothetical protein